MAIKERINPKTGKKQYKVRYYFIADGKKKDSETGWFSTKEKAEREAKLLKERKEKEDRNKVLSRRDKQLVTVFEEYIEYLQKQSEKETSNTNKQTYITAKAICRNHFPKDIQNIKINELTVFNFKSWLSYINKKDELGGLYVRLCRQNLIKFNIWLSNNNYYIDENLEELIDVGIRKVKLKHTKVGNKEESGKRNLITILDFQKITYYYYKAGIEIFRNFYYYTLFYVLYFSGMRVEELAGLQWKFINLRESHKSISIKNAISKMEDREHALQRVAANNYKTKNKTSVRIIPIFEFYYSLLLDYKESYRYEFNLSKDEIEECFVFPHIDTHNPHDYLLSNQVLRELKRVCKDVDIDNTDLQMFRHSCAYFLILPPPNGLGYTEEKVKDYFGHTDTKMLQSVYARLNTVQKANRMRDTFSDIFTPIDTDDKTKEERAKQELIQRIRGDNKKAEIARMLRIFAQIDKLIKDGRKEYYYMPKDKSIIDKYKEKKEKEHKEVLINFIEEK